MLAVAFLLADAALMTELGVLLVITGTAGETEAVVPTAAGVAAATPEEVPTCTAAPTSSCFPASGSVEKPQLAPAPLSVLPYMRHML
jgi:hypothetical protein